MKIINASSTRANFHIIAPINTNRWQISYEKPEGGVVPGKHVEITVNFAAPHKDDLLTDNIFQVLNLSVTVLSFYSWVSDFGSRSWKIFTNSLKN